MAKSQALLLLILGPLLITSIVFVRRHEELSRPPEATIPAMGRKTGQMKSPRSRRYSSTITIRGHHSSIMVFNVSFHGVPTGANPINNNIAVGAVKSLHLYSSRSQSCSIMPRVLSPIHLPQTLFQVFED
ncbi:unnamed protein product [Cuscuta epithymum]|uniref:Uncharacterized protein n=1 Tax=Cuscuta epithymum TaxID=186058 RepID=A0AAV0CNJ0_9ASTE|nr:unnamed protein product [Cuscuta epithymum]